MNFVERRQCEVRRIHLPRTTVHKHSADALADAAWHHGS
jgi:hypothetical protein